jgi:hypothetical protein
MAELPIFVPLNFSLLETLSSFVSSPLSAFLLRLTLLSLASLGIVGLFWFAFWKCYLSKIPFVQDIIREFTKPQTVHKAVPIQANK